MAEGQTATVTFEPSGQRVEVPVGSTIADAAGQAGVEIQLPCGGRGICGGCRVTVQGELEPPTDAERRFLGEEIERGIRLACQARVAGPCVVRTTDQAGIVVRKEIELLGTADFSFDPSLQAVEIHLKPPQRGDCRPDSARLFEALDGAADKVALPALRKLPAMVRRGGATLALVRGGQVVDLLGEDARVLGAAVDVGTTTVVAYLFDLRTGAFLSSASALNPQARHGADVVSRIAHASQPGGLETLQRLAADVVNRTVGEACQQAGGQPEQVREIVVVGNTCMHHLFLGIDPRGLGTSPYVPACTSALDVPASDVGVRASEAAVVHVLPVIAGYVGADTVAAILATRLMRDSRRRLLIDLGTNGEIALWDGSRLLVASCAAGPAFEGAQITHGTRAVPGAIERVALEDGDIRVYTVGGRAPVGICGSGLIDAVAALLDAGAMDETGRLDGNGAAGSVAERIIQREGQTAVVLAEAEGRQIVLTQGDVRQVQLAKAAVRAATELLLDEAGIGPEQIDEVLLAGAFGNYLSGRSAVRIGLLPEGVDCSMIRAVGNAAGAGAALALLSKRERARAGEIAACAEHVELFTRPQFQEAFAEAMLFPAARST